MALPEKAAGLVAHAAGDVRIEPVPVRVPGPDEAVVEVVYGGICGSDLHYWRHGAAGLSILKEPMLLGHEIVGVVRQGAGLAPGTPVAVHPARPGPGDGTQRYRPTGPTSPPAAPTSAAPRTGRTPKAGSRSTSRSARTCCARCPPGCRCARPPWPNPPASPGTPSAARATSGAGARW